MERTYVTAHVVDQETDGRLSDVVELNRLSIDHVSRIQGYGEVVECDDRLFLLYRSSMIEISDKGLQVREFQDLAVDGFTVIQIAERLDPATEERVNAGAAVNVFGCGFAENARLPRLWAHRTAR